MHQVVDTLHLQDVVIRSVSVSEMENNVYLLTSKETGHQVLIDAADDPAAIAELVESGVADGPGEEPSVVTVLTTHRHWDHVRALGEIAERYGATTVAGVNDAEAIAEQPGGAPIELTVSHQDVLSQGGIALRCIELRGHTPGSIGYVYTDPDGTTVLFSGDSLFPGGPGKTNSPEEFASLMDDLQERVFGVLEDDVHVFPGHGSATTIGTERPQIPEWLARGW